MKFAPAWRAALAWALAVFALTSIPGSSVPDIPVAPHADKLVHAFLYAVLAVLVARAVAGNFRRLELTSALGVLAGVMGFAVVDEWHQRFIPGRTASISDWGADLAGAVMGLMIFMLARARRETSER